MDGQYKTTPTIASSMAATKSWQTDRYTLHMTMNELMAHLESIKDRIKGQKTAEWSKSSFGVGKHKSTNNESNN